MGIQASIARRSPVRQAQASIRHLQPVMMGFAALLIAGVLIFEFSFSGATAGVVYGANQELPVADASYTCVYNMNKLRPLQIKISRNGAIFGPEGKRISGDGLRKILAAHSTQSVSKDIVPTLRIRMDPNSRALAVTSLIQTAQTEGFQNIFFATKYPKWE